MSENRFFTSSCLSLREVHAFNTLVDTLHQQANAYVPSYDTERVRYAGQELREQVMALLLTPKNYDKLEDFVPGSPKHQEILERIARYESAQGVLQDMGYQKAVICDETYLDYLKLEQHQVTVTTHEYDEYENTSFEVQRPYSFLTKSRLGFGLDSEVLAPEQIRDLCVPYVTVKRDLIKPTLDQVSHLNQRIRGMELAEKLEIKHWELGKLLPLDDVVHKSDALGFHLYAEYEGHLYSEQELRKLHQEWLAAKAQKWVEEDRYVEYPTWGTYVGFLKRVKAGEISPA